MTLPHIFANQTNPTMPELDDNYNAVGSLVTVQCVATGTNTISLAPTANAPAVTSYGAGQPFRFGFIAAGTTTGLVTASVSGLTALPVYMPNGAQATTGNLGIGVYYEIVYVASYNSGSGGWAITSVLPASVNTPYGIGSSQGLKITNDAGTPSTKIDVTAQGALFITSAGTPLYLSAVTFVIDLTTGSVTSTANGMDGEARPTSGWVYLYMISNGAAAAGLGSTVSPSTGSAPTLPSGYTYYFYIGAMFLNASQNLLGSRQVGPFAQYIAGGANLTTLPIVVSGSLASTTLSSVTLIGGGRQLLGSSFAAPLTAGIVKLLVVTQGSPNGYAAAPNNSYGGWNSTNPAPISTSSGSGIPTTPVEIVMETANIFWGTTGINPILQAFGWTDYWSK